MAVTTHLQILENVQRSSGRCVDDPKCEGQHCTVLKYMEDLFFNLYIM
jgi:hypothetical protein